MKIQTLWVMAMLCLILISCQKEENLSDLAYDYRLESRSSNQIVFSYTNSTAQDTTLVCSYVEVDYDDGSLAEIYLQFANGSSYADSGYDLGINSTSGYQLNVKEGGVYLCTTTGISISPCETNLCYNVSGLGLSGQGLSFIVEDEASGM